MGKPKAPPAVDPVALANAQTDTNIATAQYNTNAARADQIGPQGSTTWSTRPGTDPANPKPGDYIQTTSLNPEQQSLYDSENRISQNFMNTAETGLDRVAGAMDQKFDVSGLPARQTSAGLPLQTSLDRGGLPALTMGGDDGRRRVEEALMSRMSPELDRREESLRTRLANAGLEVGSEPYNREMARMDEARNDASMQAILGGGQEQSRMAGLEQAERGQLFGEEQAAAGVANDAYSRGLAGAGFANDARQQAMTEQAYLRSLPLNEVNALRTGSQVQMPNFGGGGGGPGGGAQPTDVMGAHQMSQQGAMGKYQGQMAGYNQTAGAIASVIAAIIAGGSDRRRKKNIVTIGQHPSGVRRVRWDWITGGSDKGVIAQELQLIRPDAVYPGPDGFLRVDYALIGGR